MVRISQADLDAFQGRQAPKRSKYGNSAVLIDGVRFHSKREAAFYTGLRAQQQAGEVAWFLMQVPIALPGGIRYVLDFLICRADGSLDFVDVKGHATPVYRMKKRQVEQLYPFKIREV